MSRRDPEPSERVAAILEEDPGAGPVLRLPSSVATGRYAVSRRAVLGVLLVVLVAVAVLGGRFLLAKGEAAPRPQAAVADAGQGGDFGGTGAEASPGDGSAGAAPTEDAPAGAAPVGAGPVGAGPVGAAPAASPSPTGQVTVHVAGRVSDPGVVTLPGGSRVDDALAAAGGTKGDADLAAINLARPLVDGEQVYVPERGETPPVVAGAGGGGVSPGGAAAAPGAPGAPDGAKVNLNTADLTTLETLSGVGPVLAERIVEWRTEHGGFTSVDELGEVSGIGEKTFAELAPEVTV